MSEKVSVVLASYNGENYIEQQLISLAGQTRAADEVLITDDGSTDRTADLARRFVKDRGLKNWKVSVRPENVGYARNFIEGLNEVSGDLIFFCDQDDIWHRDKIARMVRCFQENQKIDLLLSDSSYFYENTAQKQVNRTERLRFDRNSRKVYRQKNWPCIQGIGCTFAFRKRLLPVIHALWIPEYPHDLCVWHAAAVRDGIYLINEKLIDYRRHGHNVSGQFRRNSSFRVHDIQEQIRFLEQVRRYVSSTRREPVSVSPEEVKFQIRFRRKRETYLSEKDYFLWFAMLRHLSCYDRKRNWISDFLCMRKREQG